MHDAIGLVKQSSVVRSSIAAASISASGTWHEHRQVATVQPTASGKRIRDGSTRPTSTSPAKTWSHLFSLDPPIEQDVAFFQVRVLGRTDPLIATMLMNSRMLAPSRLPPELEQGFGMVPNPARVSELDLDAELDKTSRQNLGRRLPRRPVSCVDRQNRARVQRVVDVELRFDPLPLDSEHPAEADVELRDAVLELRLRWNQIDRRGAASACRQVTSERGRDQRVRGDVRRVNR